MTAANILLYVVLIAYVLFMKVQGQPMKAPRRLLGLPIILIVIGFEDLSGGKTMKPIEIAVIAVGGVLSLGLGLMRGRADKLSTRDGIQFVQWGKTSLALFGTNIVAKLVLDLVAIAAGGSASAVGKSLLFTLGLTLLGEAVVLLSRSGGTAVSTRSPSTGVYTSLRQSTLTSSRPSRASSGGNAPTSRPSPSSGLVGAIGQHHSDRRERIAQRRARRHDRRYARYGS